MKKNLLCLFMLLTLGIIGFAQELTTVTIGIGIDESYDLPLNNFYNNSWSEMIYPDSLITEHGTITSIGFDASSVPNGDFLCNTLTIYMGVTSNETHNTTSDWVPMDALTEVYSVTDWPLPTTTGWLTFDLDAPFLYNGGNLVIVVSNTMPNYTSGLKFRYTPTNNSCLYQRNDSNLNYASHPGENNGSLSNKLPNLQLTFFDTAVFCHTVSNINSSDITTNGATIRWHDVFSTNNYILQYKAATEPWKMATTVDVQDSLYNITGLNSSSFYEVRVASNCGTDTSRWKALNFYTKCEAISSLPFVENFDAIPGYSSTSASVNNLPYCWNYLNNGTAVSYSGYPIVYDNVNYASSGNNTIHFYTSSTSGTYDDQIAILPPIDVSIYPINTLQISLEARSHKASYPFKLIIGVMTDPMDKTTFVPVETIVTESVNYATYVVSFADYMDTGGYIALMAPQPASGYNYGYVDNILVEEIPTCLRPTALKATSSMSDEITLSWTETGNSTYWQIEYGSAGFTPGEGTLLSDIGTNPYTLAGLSEGVIYDFYVRSDCGAGDFSDWTPSPATASPYTLTMGITGTATVTDCNLTITDDGGIASKYSNGCNDTLVIYPGESGSVLEISGTFVGEQNVDYLSIYNGTSVDASNLFQKIVSSSSGNEVTFGPLTSNGPLTLYFHSDDDGSYDGFVAHVSCVEGSPRPFDLHTANISTEEATVVWSTLDNTVTSFNVAIGTSPGFDPYTCPTIFTSNTTEYTFTDLSPNNTNYYVKVQANCGDLVSEWSNELAFQTACHSKIALPYSENFDSYTEGVATSYTMPTMSPTMDPTLYLPDCWTFLNRSTAPSSYPQTFLTSYGNYAVSGNALFFRSSKTTPLYAILPAFDKNIRHLKLGFVYRNEGTSASNGWLSVGYMTDPSDENSFVEVQTFEKTTTLTPVEMVFDMLPAAADSARIAFKYSGGTANNYYLSIDNVSVDVPSCLKPLDLSATAVSAESVSLVWTNYNTDAANYQVAYGPSTTFNLEAGTYNIVSFGTTAITIEELTESSWYTFAVRSQCSDGSWSEWSPTTSVLTLCSSEYAALPYTEDFDAYSYGVSTSVSLTESTPVEYPIVDLPECWRFINRGDNSYPRAFLNSSENYAVSGNALFFQSSKTTPLYAVLPAFDEDLQNLMLSFTYRNEGVGANYGNLSVGYMTDPTDASTFVEVQALEQITTLTPVEILFSSLPTSARTSSIAFRYTGNLNNFWLSIDNLSVEVAPSCPKPTNLAVTNVTGESVSLEWTDPNSVPAGYYEVAYGPASTFNLETGSFQVSAFLTDSVKVSNLTENTWYTFVVRAGCGDSDYSEWSLIPVTAKTLCGSEYSELPYTENFDSYMVGISTINNSTPSAYPDVEMPDCWRFVNRNDNRISYPQAYLSSTNDWAVSGNALFFKSSQTTPLYAVLPAFDEDLRNLMLSFTYRNEGISEDNGILSVGYMTNSADTATFVEIQTFEQNTTFTTVDVVFSSLPASASTSSIAFRYTGGIKDNYYLSIDNVSVDMTTCPRPHNLQVVNATSTSIELGWTEAGTATSWDIAYGAPGFDPNASGTTIVMANSTPLTVSGLSAGTQYEFYVRARCSNTDTSPWSFKLQAPTTMVPVGLPYTADFTDANEAWLLNNGSCTNYWARGAIDGVGALFVTTDGTTPSYNISSSSVVSAQKLFTVGTADTITITYDVLVNGESGYDYLKMFLAPAIEQYPAFTSTPNGSYYGKNSDSTYAYDFYTNGYGTQKGYHYILNGHTNTIHVEAKMPNPNASPTSTSTAKLVFAWRNDGTEGIQPPASIKNLTVTIPAEPCAPIAELPYFEDFEGYTGSTNQYTKVEPSCWELVRADAPMSDTKKRPKGDCPWRTDAAA